MEVACFNKASLCVYFCSFVCQNKHTLREESKVAEATAITFSWNNCFWSQLPKQIAVLKTLAPWQSTLLEQIQVFTMHFYLKQNPA